MRVMIASEDRFFRTLDGSVYTNTTYDYAFWARYLQVFDEVVVFARIKNIENENAVKVRSDGERVRFYEVPYFIGPWQYAKNVFKLKRTAANAVKESDAFILRAPGTMSNLLWKELQRESKPYGIEVVGDPWDSLAPNNVKSFMSPWIRRKYSEIMKKQCLSAAVTSYVTEYTLQQKYPSKSWSTHYSSIELLPECYLSEQQVLKKVEKLSALEQNLRPIRICNIGTMSAFYKAQDVLIEALSICVNNGILLELNLIGDGCYRNVFEKKSKELKVNDKIKFVGRVSPGKAIIDELDKADMFILPSYTEGLPRALIEAMARGLPCIGSNVGGIPELISEEEIVIPGDAEMLAEKITDLASNPDRMILLAKNNIEVAKRYSSDILANRRNELYRRLKEISG